MNPYRDVRPGGYAWWYFDAVSDDGTRALTAIFFIGSVFSPSWAARVRRGEPARAEEHLGVNLALYERGKKRAWVMSEHGASALGGVGEAGPRIAGSAIEPAPSGRGLRVTIAEVSAPFLATLAKIGARVEGTIDIEPQGPPLDPVELSADGGVRHLWHVLMRRARVRVRFTRPDFSFDGVGYHDVNAGDGRLERAFRSWSWARFHTPLAAKEARTTIVYATHERAGSARAWVVDARDDEPAAARPAALLPEGERGRAPWGLYVPRWFAVDDDGRTLRCTPTRILEAAPFYARYAARLTETPVRSDVTGSTGVGEFLDLDRFSSRSVQFLLRFKMRRI